MTGVEYIHIINIATLIFFTGYLSYMVGKMKYSLYFCIARWVFHKDSQYVKWLKENIYYLWCNLLIPPLLVTCLVLISQLNIGLPYMRPSLGITAGIFIWVFMTFFVSRMYQKIKQNESKN